jgi:hypothetical protein
MKNLKPYLVTIGVVLVGFIVLKAVKAYLPASIQGWLPF